MQRDWSSVVKKGGTEAWETWLIMQTFADIGVILASKLEDMRDIARRRNIT